MAEGERFLSDVYNAIRKNKAVWESTMLVIAYDEHGGLYDHVAPPTTVSPDGRINNVFGFKFERLGLRVPAVVVSPYIKKGTIISDVFDHTTVIATVRKLFTKNYATNALTERDRLANTLETCLMLAAPRTDTVKFPKPAPKPVADGLGLLVVTAAPKPKPKPLHQMSEFQKAMLLQGLTLEHTLPLALQSGKTIHSFKTEHDVSRYLQDLAKRLQTATTNGNKPVARVKKAPAKGGRK